MSRLPINAHFTSLTSGRPIAFHPASVIFELPSHAELLEKVGVRPLITGVIDELMALAKVQGCSFRSGFREETMEQMIAPTEAHSVMSVSYTHLTLPTKRIV